MDSLKAIECACKLLGSAYAESSHAAHCRVDVEIAASELGCHARDDLRLERAWKCIPIRIAPQIELLTPLEVALDSVRMSAS